jgi:hypothetical protein
MLNRRNNKISALTGITGLIIVMACASASLMGCNSMGNDPGAPSPPPPTPPTLEGKIQAINDSNMSPQNKEIAIGIVKANAAHAKTAATVSGGGG